MVLTSIEIIAAIFAILSLVKIIAILFNKKGWYNFAKSVYGNTKTTSIVFVVLAIIVFYYLLQSLTIVQIVAASAFIGLLIGIGYLAYSKDMLDFMKKVYDKKISGWLWVYIIIWALIMLWTIYEIFLV